MKSSRNLECPIEPHLLSFSHFEFLASHVFILPRLRTGALFLLRKYKFDEHIAITGKNAADRGETVHFQNVVQTGLV